MNNILKSTLVAAIMLTTVSSMANDPKVELVPGNSAKSLFLKMDATSNKSIIKLIDEDANTIYSENVADASLIKKFYMSDLENGTYFLSVKNPLSSTVFKLRVQNNEVQIEKRSEEKTAPALRKVGDKVFINFLNPDGDNVNIKIVNGKNKLVYDQSMKDGFKVEKLFNFEKALRDNYTITVENGKETYYEKIVIQ